MSFKHFHQELNTRPATSYTSDRITYASNVATILGLIIGFLAFIIALSEYLLKKRDKEIMRCDEILQGINSIKYQLETMKDWVGGNYVIPKDQDKKTFEMNWYKNNKVRALPFIQVFEIENTALHHITILPAIKYFPSEVMKALAELNQSLTSFNSFLSEIRVFKFSRDPSKNISLMNKINSSQSTTNFLDNLDSEERAFAEQLLKYQFALHFNLIGDDSPEIGGLHYWYGKLLRLLTKLEEETKLERKKLEKRSHWSFLFGS